MKHISDKNTILNGKGLIKSQSGSCGFDLFKGCIFRYQHINRVTDKVGQQKYEKRYYKKYHDHLHKPFYNILYHKILPPVIIRVSNIPFILIFTCLCGWFGSSPSAAHAGTERMLGLRRIPGAYFNEKEPFNFTRPLYFVT